MFGLTRDEEVILHYKFGGGDGYCLFCFILNPFLALELRSENFKVLCNRVYWNIFPILSSSKPREHKDESEQNSCNIVVEKNSSMPMKNNVVWGHDKRGLSILSAG